MPAAPPPITYPNAGSTIKPGKRNYNAIHAATSAVFNTVHKTAIISMGGVAAVAGAILAAINAVNTVTIAKVMMQMMNMMMMMQMMQMEMSQAGAIHAVLLKLI